MMVGGGVVWKVGKVVLDEEEEEEGGGGWRECTMHRGRGEGGHARDRKQRTQCKFIRIWQVNTRWQQCCHAGGRGGGIQRR